MVSETGYKRSQDKDKWGGLDLFHVKWNASVKWILYKYFGLNQPPSLRSGPDVEYGSIFHKKSLMVFYFDTFHKQVFVHFKTFFMFLWLKLMIILIIKKSKKKFPEP